MCDTHKTMDIDEVFMYIFTETLRLSKMWKQVFHRRSTVSLKIVRQSFPFEGSRCLVLRMIWEVPIYLDRALLNINPADQARFWFNHRRSNVQGWFQGRPIMGPPYGNWWLQIRMWCCFQTNATLRMPPFTDSAAACRVGRKANLTTDANVVMLFSWKESVQSAVMAVICVAFIRES